MRRKQIPHILLLAAFVTLLNAWKPLHMDDATYYHYASHIARRPLDPYGFSLLAWNKLTPANELLAPPFILYWWASGIALWGHHPVLWKLWLFPICLILVASVFALSRRFATGLAWPVTWMVCLSPVILPALNLMLDVPALAFNLLALVVLIRAVDRDSLTLAVLSGIVAGLSLQTKYTGFLALGMLGLYSLVAGKRRLGLLSCLTSVCLFALWEGFIHYRYGISHFLFHFQQQGQDPEDKMFLLVPMLSVAGGLAPALIPLGLAACYRSRELLLLASGLIIGIFAWITLVPAKLLKVLSGGLLVMQDQAALNGYLFTALGFAIFSLAGVALGRLWKAAREYKERASVWFLSLWLVLEVAGIFALSPFMAARRVMEVTVVLALVFGRLASLNLKTPDWRPWFQALVGFNLCLGIGYAFLDHWEAETERKVVQEAAHLIRQRQPDATIWYTGYWGVQFYAEEERMRQVIPSPQSVAINLQPDPASVSSTPSTLRQGDWLVVPDQRIPQQILVQLSPPDQELLEAFEPIVARDLVHVRTVMCYYLGEVPLEHEEGPRVVLRVFRVKKDFIPETPAGSWH